MQEEVTQKTIALVIKSAKLDASILKAAMRMYLNHHRRDLAHLPPEQTLSRSWSKTDL